MEMASAGGKPLLFASVVLVTAEMGERSLNISRVKQQGGPGVFEHAYNAPKGSSASRARKAVSGVAREGAAQQGRMVAAERQGYNADAIALWRARQAGAPPDADAAAAPGAVGRHDLSSLVAELDDRLNRSAPVWMGWTGPSALQLVLRDGAAVDLELLAPTSELRHVKTVEPRKESVELGMVESAALSPHGAFFALSSSKLAVGRPSKSALARFESKLAFRQMKLFFASNDTDGSGALDRDEFRHILGPDGINLQLDEKAFDEIYSLVDTDHSGTIEIEEFVRWVEEDRKSALPKNGEASKYTKWISKRGKLWPVIMAQTKRIMQAELPRFPIRIDDLNHKENLELEEATPVTEVTRLLISNDMKLLLLLGKGQLRMYLLPEGTQREDSCSPEKLAVADIDESLSLWQFVNDVDGDGLPDLFALRQPPRGSSQAQIVRYCVSGARLTQQMVLEVALPAETPATSMRWSDDNRTLCIGCADGTMIMIDGENPSELVRTANVSTVAVDVLRWHPSNLFVAACTADGAVAFFDLALQPMPIVQDSGGTILSISIVGHLQHSLAPTHVQWSPMPETNEGDCIGAQQLAICYDRGPTAIVRLELGGGSTEKYTADLAAWMVRKRLAHGQREAALAIVRHLPHAKRFVPLSVIIEQGLVDVAEALEREAMGAKHSKGRASVEAELGSATSVVEEFWPKLQKLAPEADSRRAMELLVRRLFFCNLRAEHFEDAYRLAASMGRPSLDLFRDLCIAAEHCGEEEIAAVARARAGLTTAKPPPPPAAVTFTKAELDALLAGFLATREAEQPTTLSEEQAMRVGLMLEMQGELNAAGDLYRSLEMDGADLRLCAVRQALQEGDADVTIHIDQLLST